MWSSDQDQSERLHSLLVMGGLCLLLVAAFCLYLGNSRTDWPIARAEVRTVDVRCEMDALGPTRSARRTPSVIVPCDQADQFRAYNADRSWTLVRLYSGQVRVERDGTVVSVEMGLGRGGRPPEVGDRFEVMQNPDLLTDVVSVDRSTTETYAGLAIGGLGVFVLALAFFLI